MVIEFFFTANVTKIWHQIYIVAFKWPPKRVKIHWCIHKYCVFNYTNQWLVTLGRINLKAWMDDKQGLQESEIMIVTKNRNGAMFWHLTSCLSICDTYIWMAHWLMCLSHLSKSHGAQTIDMSLGKLIIWSTPWSFHRHLWQVVTVYRSDWMTIGSLGWQNGRKSIKQVVLLDRTSLHAKDRIILRDWDLVVCLDTWLFLPGGCSLRLCCICSLCYVGLEYVCMWDMYVGVVYQQQIYGRKLTVNLGFIHIWSLHIYFRQWMAMAVAVTVKVAMTVIFRWKRQQYEW